MCHHDDSRQGRTIIEVLIVVAIVILLLGVFLPRTSRPTSRENRALLNRQRCVNQLKVISLALMAYAVDSRSDSSIASSVGGSDYGNGQASDFLRLLSNAATHSSVGPNALLCPADDRKPANAFRLISDSNVSYFVGVFPFTTNRARSKALLVGDRNLTLGGIAVRPGVLNLLTNAPVGWSERMHRHAGNVALADGSVHRANDRILRRLLVESALATNRLVVP